MKKRNKNKKNGRVDYRNPRSFNAEEQDNITDTQATDESADVAADSIDKIEPTQEVEKESLAQDIDNDSDVSEMPDTVDSEIIIAPDTEETISEPVEVVEEEEIPSEDENDKNETTDDIQVSEENNAEAELEAMTEDSTEDSIELDTTPSLEPISETTEEDIQSTAQIDEGEVSPTEETQPDSDDSSQEYTDISQPPKEIEELEEVKEQTGEIAEAEEPVKEKGQKGKKAKKSKGELSEKDKKKRKIIIISAAIFAIIAILVTAIVTPIMVINRGKIFVGKAEDFANVNKGNYYVLTKDITYEGDLIISNPYSIDLNKHTLTVTGALVINHNNVDKVLNIGTKSGKSYTSGGMIQANTINITCSGKVEIDSAITANEVNIANANVVARGGVQANNVLNITDANVQIDAISYGEAATSVLNNSTVSITNGSSAIYELYNSTFSFASGEIRSVNADINSVFKCYTSVSGDVTGGKLVVMGKGSSAALVSGMEELWMLRDNDKIGQIILEPNKIRYIEQLATPVDMNVVLGKDTVTCIFAIVNYAGRYKVVIDNNDPFYLTAADGAQTISTDITAYVADAGEHKIAIYACALEGEEELYLESEALYYTYVHSFKLDMPQNLSVNLEEGAYYLMFDKVNFAEQYVIYINGVRYEINGADFTGERIKWDVTDKLSEVGAYSIRVGAIAKSNGNIEDSAMTLTSYIITRPQATVSDFTGVIGEDVTKVNLSWTAVDTALRYQITVFDETNNAIRNITVSGTSYTLDTTDLPAGYSVRIKALAIGYYTDGEFSDSATITQG